MKLYSLPKWLRCLTCLWLLCSLPLTCPLVPGLFRFFGRKGAVHSVGGQNLEKRIERMSSATCEMSSGGVGKGRCPRPPTSMLETPARRVPFLQTFVLAGAIFGGGAPNIEIGGRGNVLLPKQQNASRNFYFIVSKYCPPSVDHGPRLASPSTVPSLFPSPEGKERRRKANNPNHI